MEQISIAIDYNRGIRRHVLGICMLLALFLPHIVTPLLLVNPIMCLYLFFTEKRISRPLSIKLLRILFCAIIVISTALSINNGLHSSNKYILMAVNLVLLMICFPFIGRQAIPKVYYYISIIFIIGSQIVYLIGYEPLELLYEYLYPVTGENDTRVFNYMKENITFGRVFNFRLGGLFHNPNQASRFITTLVAMFLVDYSKEKFATVFRFLILAFLSILLTGSRTGFVVIFLLTGYYLYKLETISKQLKAGLYIFLLFIFMPIFLIAASESIRGLDVSEGMNDSFAYKIEVFVDYLRQPNSFRQLLIGHADPETFRPSSSTTIDILDSEYGNMVYSYGFLGLIVILAFYFVCWKYTSKQGRIYYFILLWLITSSILFSYRMCFLFMFFLSHVVSLDKEDYSIDSNEYR